jgi:hypothetical protein
MACLFHFPRLITLVQLGCKGWEWLFYSSVYIVTASLSLMKTRFPAITG